MMSLQGHFFFPFHSIAGARQWGGGSSRGVVGGVRWRWWWGGVGGWVLGLVVRGWVGCGVWLDCSYRSLPREHGLQVACARPLAKPLFPSGVSFGLDVFPGFLLVLYLNRAP